MSGKKNAVCPECGAESIRTFPHTSFCPVCQKWQAYITTNTTGKKKKAVEEPEKKTMVENEEYPPNTMIE